jgi:hypothetical protein
MFMAINELKPRMGNVNIVFDIIEKGNAREFDKFGKKGKVCNAKAKDETGEVTLTLWNDDVDKFNVGDKVQMTNGYVSEYQGEMQLGTGKFGKLELVGEPKEEKATLGKLDLKGVSDEEDQLQKVREEREVEEEGELHEIGEEMKELNEEGKEFGEDDKVFLEDGFVEEEVVDEKKHKKK